jgi:hypothetical protein
VDGLIVEDARAPESIEGGQGQGAWTASSSRTPEPAYAGSTSPYVDSRWSTIHSTVEGSYVQKP